MSLIILNIVADILIILGALIILFCAVNFYRNNNILNMVHYGVLANIYGVSTLLIGLALRNYNLQNILKIIIIIILNLIISVMLNRIFNQKFAKDIR